MLHHVWVHLFGQFLYMWNLFAWYLGELVNPQKSSGGLTLLVDFLMSSSAILIHTTTVSHLILYDKFGLGNEGCYWSNQQEAFPASQNDTPDAMTTIGACCHGSSESASSEAGEYSSSDYSTIELLSPAWKLPPNTAIFIERFPPSTPTNILGQRLTFAGCTATYIVITLFYASTVAFMTKRSL